MCRDFGGAFSEIEMMYSRVLTESCRGLLKEKEEAVRYSNPLENKTGEHPVQPVSAP